MRAKSDSMELCMFVEKFALFLDAVGAFLNIQRTTKDGTGAEYFLLKYAEDSAYPAKGGSKKKKRKLPFSSIAWVI